MMIQMSLCICTVLCFVIVPLKTFHPWLSNVPSEDSDEAVQSDLNLFWVYMSEGIFSDILTHIYLVITLVT